ncbi:hypothetical protein [Paenibacillus monticola]|uniref:Copper amine oxidase n=1 Tax=Paenibacillus monticola TaxID=2666075 RepID=A0A7X2L006_9BACL|nr:hypothetical protein [Paenibacillus monticola]MRN52267.1 hypothetical protein [Paenibacillus monticola]
MRKINKLLFLVLGLMILPGTMLYAASSQSEVSVYVNNVVQKQSGILSEGEAFIPAEQLSENLYGLLSVEESGNTVRIYKPNVNTTLLDDKGGIFGKVKSPARITFSTLVQVDNLKTEISDIKITITDPADKTEVIDTQQINNKEENFWFKSVEFTYNFNTKGSYAILVYFKDINSGKWFPVSEIRIFGI